jgi:hypothetical protein
MNESPRIQSLVVGTISSAFAGTMGALAIVHATSPALLDGYSRASGLAFTMAFAVLLGSLAPTMSWSLRPSRSLRSRLVASLGWVLALPLLTFMPLQFTVGNVLAQGVPFIGTMFMWTGGTFCAVAYVWSWSRRTVSVAQPSPRQRRLLQGAGIVCALLTVPVYLSMGTLYLGAYLSARAPATAPVPEVTFPAGFSGRALITMPVAGAPAATMVDGTWRFAFPTSGRLSFSNQGLGTLRTPRYFERSATGERVPLPSASREACDAAFADSSTVRTAASDGVCWNSVFVDQERWELEFLVLRAPDRANATAR